MSKLFSFTAIALFVMPIAPALAHWGHVGELAGHGHWIAIGAGAAAAALAAALAAGRKGKEQSLEETEDADGEAQGETA